MGQRRILVLTSTFPRWPKDREPPFVFELCRRLTRYFDIHVVAPHCRGARRDEVLENIKVTRFRYLVSKWESLAYQGGIPTKLRQNPVTILLIPFFVLAQLLLVARLLRQQNFDVIHAHWIIPQGVVAIAAAALARKPLPVICTSHGADLYALRGRFFRKLNEWVLDRAATVTVVSTAMEKALIPLGVDPGKVAVIPMGTDLHDTFRPPSKPTRTAATILFVGRLVEKKGLRYLVEALPLVLRSCPDIELVIAGTGPDESTVRSIAEDLGVSDRIKFLGARSHRQLSGLYQTATIAVFPFVVAENGDQEGFGLVVVEALGCECPVVASDLPAIHDIVRDGCTGLFAQAANPRSIAQVVISLLDDPQLREKLGRQGRKHVLECYDWKSVSKRYADAIARLA